MVTRTAAPNRSGGKESNINNSGNTLIVAPKLVQGR